MEESNNDEEFNKKYIEEESEDEEIEKPQKKKNSEKPDTFAEKRDSFLKNPKNQLNLQEEAHNYRSYIAESHSNSPEKSQNESAKKKLSKQIQFLNMPIKQFWKKDQISISSGDFKKLLETHNFNLMDYEVDELIQEFSNEEGKIELTKLCKGVELWKNHTQDFLNDLLKEKSIKIAEKLIDKRETEKGIHSKSFGRPFSSAPYTGNRPKSGFSMKSYKSKYSGLQNFKIPPQPSIQKSQNRNNSAYYLKKAKEKEQEVERLLQLTISRGKNEYEYECLIKMGEANELSNALDSKITYRAYKSADGNLKVNVYDFDKRIKELTLDEFQREYNIIKNQYNQSRKLKIWEVLNENKKNARFSPSQKKKEPITKKENELEMQSKAINKNKRQNELKQVLLDTMMLTNILKEQLQVLNKKGINGNYQQSSPYGKKTGF